MVLPLLDLLLRPIMSIAIAFLQAPDERFAMAFDAGGVLVRQPIPAELGLPLQLLPVGLDVAPTLTTSGEVCRKQAAGPGEVPQSVVNSRPEGAHLRRHGRAL
jgi:hypothetical protein